MLRSPVVYAGLSLAVLCGAYAVGCGGDDGETGAGGSAPSGPGVQPPAPPANGVEGDNPEGVTWAVYELFLGDTDRSGATNPSAWKTYGYDLDGKQSTKDSKDLCKPAAGGSPSAVYPDGNDGIDNAFGKLLLPIITGLAQDASAQVNEAIQSGSFTIILDMDGLGTQANYINLVTRLYAGTDLGAIPKFDGTDHWPVAPELLNSPTDIKSAKVSFPTSYVNEHTWVSGTPGQLNLNLAVQGYNLALNITNAVITAEMNAGRTEATNGIIAGVIPTEPLIEQLRAIAGSFDKGLCSGTTFDSLADQIRQASDILSDGTQDASKPCDAISVGLGFSSKPIAKPTNDDIGEASPPQPDPCAEGGGGTGGSTSSSGTGGDMGGSGGSGGSGGA